MKHTQWTFLIFGCITAISCAKKGDDAISEDGLCTQATVDTYNSTQEKFKTAINNPNPQTYQVAQDACVNFKNLMGDRTCHARNSQGKVDVGYGSVAGPCKGVSDGLAIMKNQKLTASSLLLTPQDQIILTVTQESEINLLLDNSRTAAFAQNMIWYDLTQLKGKDYCSFANPEQLKVKKNQKLVFSSAALEMDELVLKESTMNLTLKCKAANQEKQSWDLKALKRIFGNIAHLSQKIEKPAPK